MTGGDWVSRWKPTPVPTVADAVAVATGLDHTCAIHADGAVSCWGGNQGGAVGDGSRRTALEPVRVLEAPSDE